MFFFSKSTEMLTFWYLSAFWLPNSFRFVGNEMLHPPDRFLSVVFLDLVNKNSSKNEPETIISILQFIIKSNQLAVNIYHQHHLHQTPIKTFQSVVEPDKQVLDRK